MAKKNTGSIIALAVLAVGSYIWWKEQQNKTASAATVVPGTPAPVIEPGSAYNWPIVYNRFSEAAKLLQKEVGVTQDGIIGPKTIAAIQQYLPAFNTNFSIANAQKLSETIVLIQQARARLYYTVVNN